MGEEKRKERGAIKSIKTVLFPAKGPVKWTTKKQANFPETLLQNELNSDVARFTTHIKPVLQQIRLLTWLVKRPTSLFNSFCRNVAKQVARFCCPLYRSFSVHARDRKAAETKQSVDVELLDFALFVQIVTR